MSVLLHNDEEVQTKLALVRHKLKTVFKDANNFACSSSMVNNIASSCPFQWDGRMLTDGKFYPGCVISDRCTAYQTSGNNLSCDDVQMQSVHAIEHAMISPVAVRLSSPFPVWNDLALQLSLERIKLGLDCPSRPGWASSGDG